FDASQATHAIALINNRVVLSATLDLWQSREITLSDLSGPSAPTANHGAAFAGYAAQIEFNDYDAVVFDGTETQPFVPDDVTGAPGIADWDEVILRLTRLEQNGAPPPVLDNRVQVGVIINSWTPGPEARSAALLALGRAAPGDRRGVRRRRSAARRGRRRGRAGLEARARGSVPRFGVHPGARSRVARGRWWPRPRGVRRAARPPARARRRRACRRARRERGGGRLPAPDARGARLHAARSLGPDALAFRPPRQEGAADRLCLLVRLPRGPAGLAGTVRRAGRPGGRADRRGARPRRGCAPLHRALGGDAPEPDRQRPSRRRALSHQPRH